MKRFFKSNWEDVKKKTIYPHSYYYYHYYFYHYYYYYC